MSFSPSLALHQLNLSRFRNYDVLRLAPGGAAQVILTGPNGAGKTNILEAVSLLAPGRGLRGAALSEIQGRSGGGPWAVAAELRTPAGESLRLGTGLDHALERRVVRIDGRDAQSQAALAGVFSAVWLTPQMDRLFLEGPAQRRRFLDRLVLSHAPGHAGRVARLEKTLRERMKLLQAPRPADPRWLDGLEAQAAEDSVAVSAARDDLVLRLQAHARELGAAENLFPVPELRVTGVPGPVPDGTPALAQEEELLCLLKRNRTLDAAAGRTAAGAHRSDLDVVYAARNMPAAQCSTGEQKGLLVSIVLAHAHMMRAEKGFAPLILLDEVAAHLDAARRDRLFSLLAQTRAQVWLTGTEAALFAPLRATAAFYAVDGGAARQTAHIGAAQAS